MLSTREEGQTCRRLFFNTKSRIRKTSLNLVRSYSFKMYIRAPTEGNCMGDQIHIVEVGSSFNSTLCLNLRVYVLWIPQCLTID